MMKNNEKGTIILIFTSRWLIIFEDDYLAWFDRYDKSLFNFIIDDQGKE